MQHNIDTLDGGNHDGALFLGIEEGDRVFWDWRTDELVKPEADLPYDLGDEWVGKYIAESEDAGLWTERSPLGEFLASVHQHSDAPGMLGERQASVFALREIAGLTRRQTYRGLGISGHNHDKTLPTARKKVEGFRAVAASLGD